MKFEKEATTKSGRRTWKVTYELVRGPEPKPRKVQNPSKPTAPKAALKSEVKQISSVKRRLKAPPPSATKRRQAQAAKEKKQLGFF